MWQWNDAVYKFRKDDILVNFIYKTETCIQKCIFMHMVPSFFSYLSISESRSYFFCWQIGGNSIINKIMFITAKYLIVITATLKLFKD
jgi:hypothetical protein